MATEVGSAFVSIIPSFKGFGREIASQVGREIPNAGDKIGRDLGSKIATSATSAAKAKVSGLGAALGSARDAEAEAAGKVRVAESRLQEIRAKGNAKASQILAAEEKVASARRDVARATDRATKAADDYAQAERDAAKAAAPIKRSGKEIAASVSGGMQTAGKASAQLGTTLTRNVTLPIAGIAGLSFRAFASFDSTMRQAGAALDVPAAGLQQLTDLALKMGAETSFSAGAAADAMLELAKGGMTAAQIQGGALQQTLTLAAAGGLSLGNAATFMSNTLNTFGLGADKAGAVAAALAGGANASTASVESLGQALSQVGPGARNAGLSLNDTVGVLALFDQYGIKGSDAGTSLKTMLTRLIPSTDAAKAAMKDLGLKFTDARGQFLPIGQIADQLQKKLGGLSQAQRTTAINTIFGSDAARAASVLMRGGAPQVAAMTKATTDLGAAQKMAAVNTSGASGSMEQLQGSLETAGITIGQALAPHVIVLADKITDLVNKFTALDSETQRTILIVAGLAAALGPVFIITGKVVTGIGQTITGVTKLASATATAGKSVAGFAQGLRAPQSGLSAFASNSQRAGGAVGRFGQSIGRGLGTVLGPVGKGLKLVTAGLWSAVRAAMAFALTPIGAIITGIVALVAIGILLYKKWTPFRELVNKIGSALAAFGKAAVAVGKVVLSALVSAAKAVAGAFVVAWNAIRPFMGTIVGIVLTPLTSIIKIVKGFVNIFAGIFTGDFKRIGKGLGQVVGGWVMLFWGIPIKIIKALTPLMPKLLALFQRGFAALLNLPVIGKIVDIVTTPLRSIITIVRGIINVVVGIFTGNFSKIGTGLGQIVGGIIKWFVGMPLKIALALAPLAGKLLSLGWDALKAMGVGIGRGIVAVLKFFADLPGKAWTLAVSLITKLAQLGWNAIVALGQAERRGAQIIWDFFTALPGKVWSFAKSLPDTLANLGRTALSTMGRAISTAASAVWTFFKNLPGRVFSLANTLGDKLRSLGSTALTKLKDAVTTGAAAVIKYFKDLPGNFVAGLKNLSGDLWDAGVSAVQGLLNGVGSLADALVQKAKDLAKGFVKGLLDTLKPGSPSKVTTAIGVQAGQGLVVGVGSTSRKVAAAGAGIADELIGGVRDTLGVHSPARAMIPIGRSVVDGFVVGIRTNYATMVRSTTALINGVVAAANRAYAKARSKGEKALIVRQRNAVVAYLKTVSAKTLTRYRKSLDTVNAQIAATTAKLASLRDARAQVFTEARDAALTARDFFGSTMDALAPDPAAVLGRLKANLAAINRFRVNLATLLKRGLNAEVVRQIAAQGAEAGGQMAEVLLRSTPQQVKELNATYAAIGTAAANTGNTVAGGMYDAGIKAAQGLLAGLQSRQKYITAYLAKLAAVMVATMKKSLQIKSPSRVMAAEVGAPMGLGVVGGFDDQRKIMDRSLREFVSIPRTGMVANRLQPAGSVAGGNVRVFIGERELTDIVRVEIDDVQTQQTRRLVNGRRPV